METESCRLWHTRRMEYGYTEEGKGLYVDFRNYRNGSAVMHSAFVWLRNGREAKRQAILAFMGKYIAVHQKEEEKEKWEDQE